VDEVCKGLLPGAAHDVIFYQQLIKYILSLEQLLLYPLALHVFRPVRQMAMFASHRYESCRCSDLGSSIETLATAPELCELHSEFEIASGKQES
jgi:hypothetical protein